MVCVMKMLASLHAFTWNTRKVLRPVRYQKRSYAAMLSVVKVVVRAGDAQTDVNYMQDIANACINVDEHLYGNQKM